jgi:hypothetical protein
MDTLIGLLGMVVWIVSVVGLAAAVTYVVVRISPAEKPPAAKDGAATDS